jgi:hypothetical protein
MLNQRNESVYRLRDSGNSGVWRAAGQVPEYLAEEPAPEGDYAQRMNHELWGRPPVGLRRLKHTAERITEPASIQRASSAAWDLAVAFAIHALALPRGEARERAETRCLEALQAAIEAGHPRPAPDHPDFMSVAGTPRFLALAEVNQRRPAWRRQP